MTSSLPLAQLISNGYTSNRPHLAGLWISSRSYNTRRSRSATRFTFSAHFLRLNSGLSMAFCVGRFYDLPGYLFALVARNFGLLTPRRIATLISSKKAILLSTQEDVAMSLKNIIRRPLLALAKKFLSQDFHIQPKVTHVCGDAKRYALVERAAVAEMHQFTADAKAHAKWLAESGSGEVQL